MSMNSLYIIATDYGKYSAPLGCNRGFSIFFNIEKLLLYFIKLSKCAHKYKNIFFF